jgi:UDP-N-acetyl-alpha-D-muramoyl-L-alanyl-L-glutamate epimerase
MGRLRPPASGSRPAMTPPDQFRYDGYAIDRATGRVRCTYSSGTHSFTEEFGFTPGPAWDEPAAAAGVRILFLLAGVSYYKTTAARLVDLGDHPSTPAERAFLKTFLVHGLGEFALRNGLDLRDVAVAGPDDPAAGAVDYEPGAGRPLIPFGGGIDSIVTADAVTRAHPGAALCIVHPPADRFAAIEDAAAVTGLPVVRVTRRIDPQVRRSRELGFLNGHVPVTAIVTAAAVVAAVLEQRDAVVLSNERSASVPTLVADGVAVNHQWSKGADFERALAGLLRDRLGPALSVFSYLRPRSELWVAQQFAGLTAFHGAFRSCNRAFRQNPAERLDHWCGECDKCCFVDLVLAPFMPAADLAAVFDGHEPLADPANEDRFRTMLGLGRGPRPFECVGDVDECRAALVLAGARADRRDDALLRRLRDALGETGHPEPGPLLAPHGTHLIPDRYAPADLLVSAR